MNKNEDLRVLDQMLRATLDEFHKKYPDSRVWSSGSVRLGQWHARREEHPDSIDFTMSEKQMDELITTGKVTFSESDMLHQKEYPDEL